VSALQGRLTYGGALSGRDQNAVNKTVSGLLKLIHPSPEGEVPDHDIEWAIRLGLECRRRVKEQQKRIVPAEFRNTQFSYALGKDGVEKFVVTPELQSEDHIGRDPLPPGQVWGISPGGQGEGSGLFRIEVTEGPGSGVRILNRPAPPAFAESVKFAQQNLYARAAELVGDRNPREHEFSVQLRAYDASKGGSALGVAALLAMCSALLGKSLRGGLAVVGGLNLGGSLDPLHNAIDVVELAVEKGASIVLMPVSSRKQLFDLSDDMATKVNVLFYGDAREALIKAISD
jgi:ATP-dependent Lon protease